MGVKWLVSSDAYLITEEHSEWAVAHVENGVEDTKNHNHVMQVTIDKHYQKVLIFFCFLACEKIRFDDVFQKTVI